MTEDRDARTTPDSPLMFRDWMSRWLVGHDGGSEGSAEQDEDATVLWDRAASREAPTQVYVVPSPRSSSPNRDPERRLAWVYAYLAAGDPQVATVCFCETLKNPSFELDPSDALELAEELASAHLQQGKVDDAADLLRFTVAWSRGELGLPTPVISGRTVVASNPLLIEPATSRTRPERPGPLYEQIDDEASDGAHDEHDRDETTAVFLAPLASA